VQISQYKITQMEADILSRALELFLDGNDGRLITDAEAQLASRLFDEFRKAAKRVETVEISPRTGWPAKDE